jgi:hypothetical protein
MRREVHGLGRSALSKEAINLLFEKHRLNRITCLPITCQPAR